ncbi:Hypothetical predicted protein, partial [Paramuricea clavata]
TSKMMNESQRYTCMQESDSCVATENVSCHKNLVDAGIKSKHGDSSEPLSDGSDSDGYLTCDERGDSSDDENGDPQA